MLSAFGQLLLRQAGRLQARIGLVAQLYGMYVPSDPSADLGPTLPNRTHLHALCNGAMTALFQVPTKKQAAVGSRGPAAGSSSNIFWVAKSGISNGVLE